MQSRLFWSTVGASTALCIDTSKVEHKFGRYLSEEVLMSETSQSVYNHNHKAKRGLTIDQ